MADRTMPLTTTIWLNVCRLSLPPFFAMSSIACATPIDPEVLWIPPHAVTTPTDTSWARPLTRYRDGSADIVFSMAGADRAEELTRQLADHFERAGWHRRDTQYMNPTHITSFATGWRGGGGGILSLDAQGRRLQNDVFLWHGEWEDNRGNIIVYRLQAMQGKDHDHRVTVDQISAYASVGAANGQTASVLERLNRLKARVALAVCARVGNRWNGVIQRSRSKCLRLAEYFGAL